MDMLETCARNLVMLEQGENDAARYQPCNYWSSDQSNTDRLGSDVGLQMLFITPRCLLTKTSSVLH